MLAFLKPYFEKIDERVLRERVLIFASVIAVVFMLWNFLIQAPIDKKTKDAKMLLDSIATQHTLLQTQIATATQVLLNDPDITKKTQLTQLQSDIGNVENQLHSASESLIRAEQLPEALQQVLQKTAQLRLLEVQTLPAKELQFVQGVEAEVDEGSAAESKQNINEGVHTAGVYKHTVVLKVSGSYFQVVGFLVALEQLPWKFYWQSLDYQVLQYPTAEITLRVYTLSSEEGLFGV